MRCHPCLRKIDWPSQRLLRGKSIFLTYRCLGLGRNTKLAFKVKGQEFNHNDNRPTYIPIEPPALLPISDE